MDTNANLSIHQPKSLAHREYQGHHWYLTACFAFILLTLCFLIAGLTLGLCGLDSTLLQMRSITGTAKQRKQARVVMRMKQNASWMLCSLIICSVACGEYFPFIIQDLCGSVDEWVPILLSTLLLAVFAEILPQWLIPRHAISWGYYCWPLIWGCMWLTAIISFPLAWILDNLGKDRKDLLDVFTNKQLGLVIKCHEQSEKRGGDLSSDATRFILGILSNDGRKIGGDISRIPELSCEDSGKDIEKAERIVTRGMIVRWSAVKTIDINEVVDRPFIEKIMGWSYSRIPVVGKPNIDQNEITMQAGSDWEGTRVFGFLHTKNLVGLDLSITVLVKDLPLYPLPIIRDNMSVYELLYMFQLGMSRMAIVVPATRTIRDSPLNPTALWTGTKRNEVSIESRIKRTKNNLSYWTTDYLTAAQAGIESLTLKVKGRRIQGIRSPKPIGIITFEDIIDALFQRTSRDEKDFFDRETAFPPTKVRKTGDYPATIPDILYTTVGKVADVQIVNNPIISNSGTLRQRKISKRNAVPGIDGADDQSSGDGDELKVSKSGKGEVLSVPAAREDKVTFSFYAENGQGGFHDTNCSASSVNAALASEALSYMAIASWSDENRHLPFESATLPSRNLNHANSPQGDEQLRGWQNFTTSSRENLTSMASPFSRVTLSSFQSRDDGTITNQLIMPMPLEEQDVASQGPKREKKLADVTKRVRYYVQDSTGDTISISSWGGDSAHSEGDTLVFNADLVPILVEQEAGKNNNIDRISHSAKSQSVDRTVIVDNVPLRLGVKSAKPYDGFPPELLDSNKENQCPDYSSKTMPRLMGFVDEDFLSDAESTSTPLNREKSFHDDRAMLPSQRRALTESIYNGRHRSSSMWL